MNRIECTPRSDWEQIAETLGFFFHSVQGGYWFEGAYYEFTRTEADDLEAATNELHELCLEAVSYVIERDLFDRFCIPQEYVPMILRSWERKDPAIYGRFDLAFDGYGMPKLLEYNADTPTGLLEAGVAQWQWHEQLYPDCDQFNSVHARLVNAWKKTLTPGSYLHFTCFTEAWEDEGTLQYIRETAIEAGFETMVVDIQDIGWNQNTGKFVDEYDGTISSIFKIYPWEWMLRDLFAQHLKDAPIQIFEPAWKMILSNKAILPVLWELFPEHPYLLPAYFDSSSLKKQDYVRKPIFSREGANVSIIRAGKEVFTTTGEYGKEGYVYQELFEIPDFSGHRPIIGSWVIDGKAAGIGIREDESMVTKNTSWFVPHLIANE